MNKPEINLLPDEVLKRRRVLQYFTALGRYIQRVCLILIFVLAAEIALLFVYQSLDKQLAAAYGEVADGLEDIDQQVADVNAVIDKIQKERKAVVSWSQRIEDVFALIPEGIYVVSLRADEDGTMVLVGSSGSRSDVLALEGSLRGVAWVEKIDAPLQNFALDPGSEFTFTLYEDAAAAGQ